MYLTNIYSAPNTVIGIGVEHTVLCVKLLQLFSTPCDPIARKAPLSMAFSSQEYWSGFPCLLQGIFQIQRLNLHLHYVLYYQLGSLPLVPPGKPW